MKCRTSSRWLCEAFPTPHLLPPACCIVRDGQVGGQLLHCIGQLPPHSFEHAAVCFAPGVAGIHLQANLHGGLGIPAGNAAQPATSGKSWPLGSVPPLHCFVQNPAINHSARCVTTHQRHAHVCTSPCMHLHCCLICAAVRFCCYVRTSTGSKPSSLHMMRAEVVLPMPGGPLRSTAFFFMSAASLSRLQRVARGRTCVGRGKRGLWF